MNYSLLSGNCEHFATSSRYGVETSLQVANGFWVLGFLISALCLVFKIRKEKKEKKERRKEKKEKKERRKERKKTPDSCRSLSVIPLHHV